MKKYELTDETTTIDGHILHRIKALRSFSGVEEGDLGGFVESEANLSHDGEAWVFDEAWVCDEACVFNKAWVFNKAVVCNKASIHDEARAGGEAMVNGKAVVCGGGVIQ